MICLVRPPGTETFRFSVLSVSLPLGLAYIAGALEGSGREVQVIDAVGEDPTRRTRYVRGYLIGLPLEEIAARIPAEADFIGLTVIFTHEWPAVVRLVELIKARHPTIPVVLGGEHITSLPEFCLATSKADILVLGEGEETIVELAAALESGRPLHEVEGIGFRDGDAIVINRRRRRTRDADSLAWPAWHLFKVDTYHAQHLVGGIYSSALTIPMLATRGCPYQCTYCSAPNMWTPLWVARDPAKVVDEIEHYISTFGARSFHFQDLTAIIQREWIIQFCREILRRGLSITWQLPTGTRSEAIDREVAELLAQTGMVGMTYAPESASDTTRMLIKKKMKLERLFASIHAAVAAGLNVSTFTVVGFPHDTKAQLAENLPFVDRLAAAGVTDYITAFYMALPGTELFHSLYDANKVAIDRRYFRHLLQNSTLVASQGYCEHLTRWQLMWWKLRLQLRFYRKKGRAAGGAGLFTTAGRAVKALRSGEHTSKLETAFHHAFVSAWYTVQTRFGRAWMPRADERRLFEGWDAIYRGIRAQQRATGVLAETATDPTRLYQENVVTALRRNHDTSHRFAATPTPPIADSAVGVS